MLLYHHSQTINQAKWTAQEQQTKPSVAKKAEQRVIQFIDVIQETLIYIMFKSLWTWTENIT